MSDELTDAEIERFNAMARSTIAETNEEIARRDIAILRLVAEVRRLRALTTKRYGR